tara:strand:+ start:259 stop:438 length:180 start_codon:yes stop_codon:yes gene_type:complete
MKKNLKIISHQISLEDKIATSRYNKLYEELTKKLQLEIDVECYDKRIIWQYNFNMGYFD